MSARRIALQTTGLIIVTAALVGSPVAHASSGGPDAYGYTWADNASGGPTFDYTFAPTSTSLGAEDSETVTLPFAFEFYGQSYTTARIQSNGVLTFGLNSTLDSWNQCISSASFTGIAPWWDDLDPSAGTIYYGSTGSVGSRIYIVEWYDIEHDSATGSISFEIKLFEADNHIEFHYSDVTTNSPSYSSGTSGTVGLSDWGLGSQVSCNGATLSDSYAIGFYPPTSCSDSDLDGYDDSACGGLDCDDSDPSTYPGAVEVCDFVDNNCDSLIDEGYDSDADGWTTCNGDCDDTSWAINPTATDSCDGLDNDCDGTFDEGHDVDTDGWTWCDGDCDDTEPSVNPSAWEGSAERCFDGLDNDCDGYWDLDDFDCEDFVGDDDDDSTGDDDDSTGDDDDSQGDDDDSQGDDDDSQGDDDDSQGDDDDSQGDDDDSQGDDDDSAGGGDDDDDDGGRGGSRGSSRACDQGGATPTTPLTALLFSILTGLALRRKSPAA